MKNITSTLILFFFLTNPVFTQNIHYVNHLATGSETGQNWANAFREVQDALQVAQIGDLIWVAKGVYFTTPTTDRAISFQLKKGVQLLGGFSGSETSVNERNPAVHATILSGNIGNPTDDADNSYNVVMGDQLDDNTLMDGIIVEGGYNEEGFGGGIFIWETNGTVTHPVIQNCTFRKNFALSGGAAYVDVTQPLFQNCVFESNKSLDLAGAFLKVGPSPLNDTFKIINCKFIANRIPEGAGGAIFFKNIRNSVVLVKGCTFERDSSWSGGAITSKPELPAGYISTIIVDSCTFFRNWSLEGAAILYRGVLDGEGHQLNVFLLNSTFTENKPQSLTNTILFDVSQKAKVSLVVDRCLFRKNTIGVCMNLRATNDSELNINLTKTNFLENLGGGIFARVWEANKFNRCTATIDNCLFANNRGALGFDSRAENNYVHTTVSNCTFFSNGSANNHNIFGKSTYYSYNNYADTFNNAMYINNCAVWEPQQETKFIFANQNRDVPGVYYPTGNGYEVRNCSFSFPSYDTFIYFEGEFWDNLYATYPLFNDTIAKDFRLQHCSPLINRGLNVGTGANVDLDGLPRIVGDTIDIGAYEKQELCVSSDQEATANNTTLDLWPNPSPLGQLCFTVPEKSVGQVYDILGNMVAHFEAMVTDTPECQSLPHLPDGVYMVLFKGRKNTVTGKWVKATGR